jgi:D-arabinose 1-dehydrogenase-like Zn-dependent alcohol dehydrogenase
MRAVRFDAFGEMPYVAEVPRPVAVVGGAVIRVEAAGLCRSDWHGWQGHDPDIRSLPHTPGHEFAGVVHAVGDGVARVHVGDRVVVPFICGCGECTWCVSGSAQVCPNQQPQIRGCGRCTQSPGRGGLAGSPILASAASSSASPVGAGLLTTTWSSTMSIRPRAASRTKSAPISP